MNQDNLQGTMTPGFITHDQSNGFRLMLVLDVVGKFILKKIFEYGTKLKDPNKSLVDYLRIRNRMSMADFRKKFSATSREKIHNDSSFDIGTWYLIVQYGCDNIASPTDHAWLTPGTLENHLKCIVDVRNNVMRFSVSLTDAECFDRLEEERRRFEETAFLIKSRYSLDENAASRMINQLHSEINRIRDGLFEEIDLASEKFASLFKSLKDVLKKEGIPCLKAYYKDYSMVDPAFLVMGYVTQTDVEEIYIPPQILEVDNIDLQSQSSSAFGKPVGNTRDSVYLEDILKVAHTKDNNVILLEGTAGVGKTTVVKKLLSDWIREKDVEVLSDYDFIILLECRNQYYDSLTSEVCSLMSEVARKFRVDNHVVECLLDMKTLFILEGVDEMNSKSEKVIKEVLKIDKKNVTILCTVRPDKVDELYQIIADPSRVLHLRVEGLSETDIKEFVVKYHKQFQALKVTSDDNANGFLSYLETTGALLQEQWSIPVNLALATLLWFHDKIYSPSCPVELMKMIRHHSLSRIHSRVAFNHGYRFHETLEKIELFESLLAEVALIGIRDSNLVIPVGDIEKLKEKCLASNCLPSHLPLSEFFGAFLLQVNAGPPSALIPSLMFSCKSLQHFYAALHIYNIVFKGQTDGEAELMEIYKLLVRKDAPSHLLQEVSQLIDKEKAKRMTVTDVLSQINKELADPPSRSVYQKTLIFLLKLLHLNKVDVTNNSACELIELLKEAGLTDCDQWMMILNSIKCDPMVSKVLITAYPELLGRIDSITDMNVFALSTIMEHSDEKKLDVLIKGKPSQIAYLDELCNHLVQRNITIKNICLEHLFRFPGTERHFMESLLLIMKNCKVEGNYLGQFPQGGDLLMEKTMETRRELLVSLANAFDADLLFSHLQLRKELEQPLLHLSLNVGNLPASALQSIPGVAVQGDEIMIFLPDIEDEQRAVDILQTLNPDDDNGFSAVYFPRFRTRSSLGGCCSRGIRSLIDSLQMLKVRMYLVFPSKCRPSDNDVEEELQEVCKRSLQCSYGIRWGPYEGQEGEVFDMDTW